MRAIIIEDKDCKALIEKLKLDSLVMRDRLQVEVEALQKSSNESTIKSLIQAVHRSYHYEVVKWMQEQGASLH